MPRCEYMDCEGVATVLFEHCYPEFDADGNLVEWERQTRKICTHCAQRSYDSSSFVLECFAPVDVES